MSTWYHIHNAKVPPGTTFPCRLPDEAWRTIEDEERFLARLQRYPGIVPGGGEWEITKDGEYAGALAIARGPTPGSLDLPNAIESLQAAALDRLLGLVRQPAAERLVGFSVHMDPLHLLPLYDYMKRAFPGLVIGKDDSELSYDAQTWEARAKSWLAGGAYHEDDDGVEE